LIDVCTYWGEPVSRKKREGMGMTNGRRKEKRGRRRAIQHNSEGLLLLFHWYTCLLNNFIDFLL
jgi:hypothetical protein